MLAGRKKELTVVRRETRPAEIAQLVSKLAENRETLAAARKAKDESEAWNTYLACNTVPSPLDVIGINDYLSLWKDDHLPWDFSVDEVSLTRVCPPRISAPVAEMVARCGAVLSNQFFLKRFVFFKKREAVLFLFLFHFILSSTPFNINLNIVTSLSTSASCHHQGTGQM